MKLSYKYRPKIAANHTAASRASAFTLIELLVVIAILGMLTSIIIPAYTSFSSYAVKIETHGRINHISTGIKLYHQELGDYPPAIDPNFPVDINKPGGKNPPNPLHSAKLLCFYLTGYVNDAGSDQLASAGAGFYTDDGWDGYGFRKPGIHRGKKLGPFNDLQNAVTKTKDSRKYFVDDYGQAIMYGRFNRATSTYEGSYLEEDDDLADYSKKTSTEFFRQDYILLNPGKNGLFEPYTTKPSTDDVTNFLP